MRKEHIYLSGCLQRSYIIRNVIISHNNKSREVLSQWFNYFNKDPDAQFLCPAIPGIDFISKPVARQKKNFPEFPQQTSLHVSLARICSLVHFQNEQQQRGWHYHDLYYNLIDEDCWGLNLNAYFRPVVVTGDNFQSVIPCLFLISTSGRPEHCFASYTAPKQASLFRNWQELQERGGLRSGLCFLLPLVLHLSLLSTAQKHTEPKQKI